MDIKEQLDLLNASIDLELNVSSLYLLYCDCYTEDAAFWWRMAMEEKNHAAILRGGEQYIGLGMFPEGLLYGKLDVIEKSNADILTRIARHETEDVSAEEAYQYALHLEDSAAELHFQKAMCDDSDSPVMQVFQRLCGDDKEHAQRIRELLKEKGFSQSL